MLTELRLENFKCFRHEVVLPVGRLNLLTGINGKGKSTALQALLLVHQSVDRSLSGGRALERVELNGRYLRLGGFREVQNRYRSASEAVTLAFEFTSDDAASLTTLELQQKDGAERWAGITRIEVECFAGSETTFHEKRTPDQPGGPVRLFLGAGMQDEIARRSRLAELGRVHYVSADRLGPQDFFPRSDDSEFLSVGVRGEMTAEVLYRLKKDQVTLADTDPRTREEAATLLIDDQASAWLFHTFDGGAVRVDAPQNIVLSLEMNADGSAHYYRAVNLGFGYSYALPILVAGLMARPGEFLVVENPEAHLHPLAQSRIGEFLATVSATGVQVFVESHSEHVLNAFRLAVREGRVLPEALRVLYFRRDDLDPVIAIQVQPDGRIAAWPEGFFDQRLRDFSRLFSDE